MVPAIDLPRIWIASKATCVAFSAAYRITPAQSWQQETNDVIVKINKEHFFNNFRAHSSPVFEQHIVLQKGSRLFATSGLSVTWPSWKRQGVVMAQGESTHSLGSLASHHCGLGSKCLVLVLAARDSQKQTFLHSSWSGNSGWRATVWTCHCNSHLWFYS